MLNLLKSVFLSYYRTLAWFFATVFAFIAGMFAGTVVYLGMSEKGEINFKGGKAIITADIHKEKEDGRSMGKIGF